jgi:flagellar hook-associated protein 1 FlgK
MTGLLRGLQIGVSSLMAHQRALNVNSQNIANMNTPGYQRQRVDFQEIDGPSGYITPPYMGNGVSAQTIERFVTPFIDEQLRRQRGNYQFASQTQDLLSDIESVLNEPENVNIAAHLDQFWQAWQDLSIAPADESNRVELLHVAAQLTDSFNEAHRFIETMRTNLDTQVRSQIDKINDIADRIAGLNKQILVANAQVGGKTSGSISLEQRRDQLLFDLADITDSVVTFQPDGIAKVTIGNYALVDDSGARKINLDENLNPIWSYDNSSVAITSGKLGGLLSVRDGMLPDLINRVDEIAQVLIENVNNLHSSGFGTDGSTGIGFFTGNDARSIAVNKDLFDSPDAIATASSANSPGDNSVALQVANLARTPVIGGTPPTVSINGAYRSFITFLGSRSRQAQNDTESKKMVLDHLLDRRQALSGVSLDEEVSNMLSYEKAFQAGARIITVVDEMLDQVINRMGIVGR